jgi:titin
LTKPLRDQHVKPKTVATFKCELYKDTPNWKWFKGDEEIPTDPTNKIEVKKDGKDITLTIKNAQPDDVGEYAIEVEGRRYAAKLTLGGVLDRLFIYYLLQNIVFVFPLNTIFDCQKYRA